jgi:hypothetical protein
MRVLCVSGGWVGVIVWVGWCVCVNNGIDLTRIVMIHINRTIHSRIPNIHKDTPLNEA